MTDRGLSFAWLLLAAALTDLPIHQRGDVVRKIFLHREQIICILRWEPSGLNRSTP
jgi:hypothetical protein